MIKVNNKIPKRLQGVFWSVDVNQLDLVRDKVYIIHQILAYGRMEELQWLYSVFPKNVIAETFSTQPYKDYRNARFHFVKDTLLQLDNLKLNEKFYVKNTPRDLGQSQAESI